MGPRSAKRSRSFHPLAVIVALLIMATSASSASADAFNNYQYTRTVTLPTGTNTFDIQPDGRLAALSGLSLYTETAAGSGQFALYGVLPAADISYGAAFIRFSPDGSKIAVGNNGSGGTPLVGVFQTASLAGTWHELDHFDAEWFDNNNLAINSGDFATSRVSLFDSTTLSNMTIISGVQGGSGGVAFDAQGRLYTGNGYANGSGSTTGEIRAFEQSAWQAALGGTPIDFETAGVAIGDVLSANSLGFDIEGNLHVAGGDFSQPDYGYAGLISATAIEDALNGGGPIEPASNSDLLRLDPDGASSLNFYSITASPAAAELYVKHYGVDMLHVYSIPEPAAVLTLIIGLSVLLQPRRRPPVLFSATPRSRR